MRALLDTVSSPQLELFLVDWPKQGGSPRASDSASFSALRWLPHIFSEAPRAAAAVTGELRACAARLHWRQTYTAGQVSQSFLDNYVWTELFSSSGGSRSSSLAAGFLILGPQTAYPRHAHPAEEIYLPLSGSAQWWKEGGGWCEMAPLTLIHHESDQAHAMSTADKPMLALYLWHGAGIDRKAQLLAPELQ